MNTRELRSEVPDELRPMIGGFLSRRREEVARLREQLFRGDFGSIAAIAHRMKGNGAAFGFQVITDLGRELETGARAADGAECSRLIVELEAAVGHFCKQFRV